MTDLGQRLRDWAVELRSIANEGLHYDPDHPYHPARFRRVRRIASELFALQSGEDAGQVESVFSSTAFPGTPMSGADAAVFDERGRILLIQRNDSRLWAMPGGACDVGETAAEAAVRETTEETGLEVEPVAFVGIYDSRLCGTRTVSHLYHLVFACRPLDAKTQSVVTHETLDAGWFDATELPELHYGHNTRVLDAFRHHRGEMVGAFFDR